MEQLSAFFVLFPFLTSPDKSWRAGSLALVSVIGFLWMTSVSAQLIFDIPLLVSLRIPALMAIQSVELPLLFLERLSSVYMATWIAQAFVTIALTLWLAAAGLSYWTKTQGHQVYVFPLLPLVYLLATIPTTFEDGDQLAEWLSIAGAYLQIVLTAVLLLIAILRKEGESAGSK